MRKPLTRYSVPCPVLDMQQTYDMWLKKHNPGKPGEGTPISSREGEKQIQMPTDYADIMVSPTPLPGPCLSGRAAWRGPVRH
jgi:hypothetical protein